MKSASSPGIWRIIRRLLLTALVFHFIQSLTLHSARVVPMRSTFLCLWGCGSEEMRDLVSNILLFVPLGWVLSYWTRPRIALAICVVATIGIEATQGLVLVGRDPSLRDILTNALGGAIGIWLQHHWQQVRYPNARNSGRYATFALGGAIVVMALTAWGTRPAGTDRQWWGHWGNHLAFYAPFDGEVRDVRMGDWTPPFGPIDTDNPLRRAIARDSIDVQVTAVNTTVTGPIALVFAVMDEYDEMLFVGAANRSVQFQVRTRFNAWGMRGLSLRLPTEGSYPGDTLEITGRVRPDTWHLKLHTRGATDSISIPLTVGLGWATLLPANLAMAYEWYVMNALWLMCLVIPGAYWLHRARARRSLLIGAGTLAVALLLIPLVTGIAASTPSDWIGTALGLLIGVLIARRSLTRYPVADGSPVS